MVCNNCGERITRCQVSDSEAPWRIRIASYGVELVNGVYYGWNHDRTNSWGCQNGPGGAWMDAHAEPYDPPCLCGEYGEHECVCQPGGAA